MSKIVVFGANGGTGRLIVEQALHAGHDVTAAVRRPSGPGQIAADVQDPASVAAAVTGQDVVISAIGPPGRKSLNLYSTAARALVAAMDHGRLILITSSGVRPDDPNFPLWYRVLARTLVKELYADMRLAEEIIQESALDWTFVRPTRLLDKPAVDTIRIENNQTPEGGWQIPRANVARFIITELEEDRWSHQAPTLAL